jgi:hypothetical protein
MQAEVRQLWAAESVPVAGTLDRTSNELRKLASVTDSVQHLVGQMLLDHQARDLATLVELQRLDHLCQSIAAIADFLEALAASTPPHWSLDVKSASKSVKLAELALRLASAADHAPAAHAASVGDCELFDARMAG